MKDLWHYYLRESEQEHEYVFKIARRIEDAEMDRLERHLRHRYEVIDVGTPKKMRIQKNARDFRSLGPDIDPYFFKFRTRYPASPSVLLGELSQKTGIHEKHMIVQGVNDPLYVEAEEEGEDRLEPKEKNYKPRLLDPDYSEHPNPDPKDYFGDAYNEKFVKGELKKGVGTGFSPDPGSDAKPRSPRKSGKKAKSA